MRKTPKILLYAVATLIAASCSMTRNLPEDQSILVKNNVEFNGDKPEELQDLKKYIKQSPKNGIFGWQPGVALYNSANGKGKLWDKIARGMGREPLIFDEDLVASSVKNMLNHMEFQGFYNSTINTSVEKNNKKTTVNYYVTPGKRYIIDTVTYSVEDVDLMDLLSANQKGTLVKRGEFLSENILDKESERLAKIFRNSGYYGFDKNFFFFTGDTLSHNDKSHLDISIKEYRRTEKSEDARPHRVFEFDSVIISANRTFLQSASTIRSELQMDSETLARRDSLLRVWRTRIDTVKYKNINLVEFQGSPNLVRKKVLNRLNLIKPGTQYDERVVENTYSRFASVNLFNTVNIQQEESSPSKVKTSISLQAGALQGYKLNLEGSTNSNSLLGLSPAISYFHKNLFNGAELFTISLMGDFQFKLRHKSQHSLEFGASTSLDIPKFLFAPDSWFHSATLPHTELNASINYQTRPEYRRNIISGRFGYTWSIRRKLQFKISPVQANIIKIYDIDSIFYAWLSDPFLKESYRSHFDLGTGASIYYTSDPASNPVHNYFYIKYRIDLAGNVLSLFNSSMKKNEDGEHLIWKTPYSQYHRHELSAVYTIKFGKDPSHMVAFRVLGGMGKGYGNSHILPLEKLFWGGGAYDMRGWQSRTLGPGSAPRDTAYTIPNQTGDIKLEANVEYRFPMFWILKGALFADAGNVWTFDHSKKLKDAEIDKRGVFRTSDFYKHIALDWGVGARLDLTFAIIRLDLGFKTFNPATSQWNGPGRWFKKNNFQFNFGIGYPF